ncbi:uncharacterized protein LOC143764312 [Ranitomeya variabilis]|uniref:uncharacterized protein LOC143764312 n=1 Tax=Ranitomeya variabilis TaxID=490064 RepID=UPI0040577F99
MSEFVLASDPFTWEKGFVKIVKIQLNIRNFQNELLVANPDTNDATFQTYADAEDENAKFYLVIYKMLNGQEGGQPVAVSCTVGDKDYLLSVENNSVILKESEVPELIPLEGREFIFYIRGTVLSNITFESLAEPGFFLSSNEEDSSLILMPHSEEEPENLAKLQLGSIKFTEMTPLDKIKKKIPYNFWNIRIDINHSEHESSSFFEESEDTELSDLLSVFKPVVSTHIIPFHIQNHMKEFLVADPEKHIVTFESNGLEKDEQSTFYVNMYRQSSSSDGLPVVLSCKVHNQNYLMCAASESITLKLNELPNLIEGESELIFYMKEFSPGHSTARLELSSDRTRSIACNLSEKKLILKQYNNGEVDETMEFTLEDKTKHKPHA